MYRAARRYQVNHISSLYLSEILIPCAQCFECSRWKSAQAAEQLSLLPFPPPCSGVGSLQHSNPASALSPDHSTSESRRDTSESSPAFSLHEAGRAREAFAKIFSSMKTTHRASQGCVRERVCLEAQDACSHFSHSRATV